MLFSLAAFAAALVPGVSLHRPLEVRRPLTAQRTAPLLASETTRGQLLRAVHQVADLEAVASFYSGFGMCAAESSEERMLLTGSVGALDLEIVRRPGSGYVAGAGYAGLSMRVPDVAAAVAAAVSAGGTVVREAAVIDHGPSNEPEEDDETTTPMLEAVVTDPGGYPVLLFSANDTAAAAAAGEPALCCVRLEVYEWKASREWWEANGMKVLRWQSDVSRQASITITLGGGSDEGPVAPCGPAGAEQPGSLLQLVYHYGSKKRGNVDCGLQAVVLAAGEGDAAQLTDPNSFPVVLE